MMGSVRCYYFGTNGDKHVTLSALPYIKDIVMLSVQVGKSSSYDFLQLIITYSFDISDNISS